MSVLVHLGGWGLGLEGRVGVSWTGLYFGPMRELGTAEGYFLFHTAAEALVRMITQEA